ncbi:hypothetical protein EDD99_2698 [Streptomyces sp. 846.5]|nr:SAV_915 family protein [Streptomyces sp. 846.5]TDU04242.1 hypothetical protein EDD99_2698 [Streptomyces sp. 846.5]
MSRIDRALNPGSYFGFAENAVLVVPAHLQHPLPDAAEAAKAETVFELLEGAQGPVPVGFTSIDLLVQRLGPAQPWAAVPARQYTALMDRLGLGPVVIDPSTDPSARRWTPADLDQYERMR